MQNRMKHVICSKAAVFSDIHANYHAFKACYEDARLHGADCYIFLGDYISDLADTAKTLDLVYEIRSQYPAICLRGNRERYMMEHKNGDTVFREGSKTGSLLYTFNQLRDEDHRFIESLSFCDMIGINGVTFEIAHSTKDDDRFYFEKEDRRIQSVFAQMECDYLLTGHSHRQYIQSSHGKTIINPGSIGIPQGGVRWPQYALLEISNHAVQCRFRQVPYDLKAVIHAQFESGLVACARYWAIGVLYDIITGRECALALLDRVRQAADGIEDRLYDENLWHIAAEQMGMRFTEEEILALLTAEHLPMETSAFSV